MISITIRRHSRNFDRVNLFKKCLKQIWHLKSTCLLAFSIEIINKAGLHLSLLPIRLAVFAMKASRQNPEVMFKNIIKH